MVGKYLTGFIISFGNTDQNGTCWGNLGWVLPGLKSTGRSHKGSQVSSPSGLFALAALLLLGHQPRAGPWGKLVFLPGQCLVPLGGLFLWKMLSSLCTHTVRTIAVACGERGGRPTDRETKELTPEKWAHLDWARVWLHKRHTRLEIWG